MVGLTAEQIDALAVGFTVFASIWLLFTVLYMATVCLFFRMRNRGDLRGSMSDPAWGRAYLFGSTQFYIPLGWLFRRYVMHQRSGEERDRIARIRVMSVEERRAALKELLEPSMFDDSASSKTNIETSELAAEDQESSESSHQRILTSSPCDSQTCASNNIAHPEQASSNNHISLAVKKDEVRSEKPYYIFHLFRPTDDRDADFGPQELPNNFNLASITKSPEDCSVCSAASAKAKSDHQESVDPTESKSLGLSDCQAECPICFVAYDQGQACYVSDKCSHRFHWDCILSWLEIQSHRDCPCCRTEILPEEKIWEVVQRQRKEKRRVKPTVRQEEKSTRHDLDRVAIRRGATEDEGDEFDSDVEIALQASVNSYSRTVDSVGEVFEWMESSRS
ncbi:hypothetical protein ACA910_022240 [Epithemia clementina (nom. ined.)]